MAEVKVGTQGLGQKISELTWVDDSETRITLKDVSGVFEDFRNTLYLLETLL